MNTPLKSAQGFTLLEVVVSMVVIAILAGIVLGGARSLLHRQRFANATEKVRILVQQARNRSETQVESIKTFGVRIPVGDAGDIQLFEDVAPHDGNFGVNDIILDSLAIVGRDFRTEASKDGGVCGISATILFTTHNEAASLYCNGDDTPTYLKINLLSTQNQTLARSYLIHRFSGVLQ